MAKNNRRKNPFNSNSNQSSPPDKMSSSSIDTSYFPDSLQANLSLLSEKDISLCASLLPLDQEHLFSSWPPLGTDDEDKRRLLDQLHDLDLACGHGGISDYIKRAKQLLDDSKQGVNPFEGWEPEVPQGEELSPFTHKYAFFEQLGQALLGRCAFVLVAGGLGERLGYKEGIKIGLPCETLSSVALMSEMQLLLREEIIQNKCIQEAGYENLESIRMVDERPRRSFAELYSSQILSMQERYTTSFYDGLYEKIKTVDRSSPDYKSQLIEMLVEEQKNFGTSLTATSNRHLPFAIMVSDDTAQKTSDLFQKNDFFGLDPSQVSFIKQGKVPALMNSKAQLALDSPYLIETKPHGHGDVHSLLNSSGLLPTWQQNGIEYVIFLQDTNALSLLPLPVMLGVSFFRNLDVNSLAVKRVAKQSVGALISLNNKKLNQKMTINVEYNVLDPLLRATTNPEGDVNDPATGFSIYPGNINQLLFRLAPYKEILERTKGMMPEFVNPKYKDESKDSFKKPTRLECMMQDYPRLLREHSSESGSGQVGFTVCPAWLCYSPLKNSLKAASESANSPNSPPLANALSAESDVLMVYTRLLNLMIRKGVNFSNYWDLLDETSPLCQRTKEIENLISQEDSECRGGSNNFLSVNSSSNINCRKSVIAGIETITSPRVVFYPSFLTFPHEMIRRIPQPLKIFLSNRASLTVKGDVILNSLNLDGSLVVVGDSCELDDYSLPSLQSLASNKNCASSSNLFNSLGLNTNIEEVKDAKDSDGQTEKSSSGYSHYTMIIDTNNKKTSCDNMLSNGGDQLLHLQEDLPYNPNKNYSSAITPVDAMRGYVLVRHENCALISPNYLSYIQAKKAQRETQKANKGEAPPSNPLKKDFKALVFNGCSYIETNQMETIFNNSNQDLNLYESNDQALTESVKLNRCIPCFGFH